MSRSRSFYDYGAAERRELASLAPAHKTGQAPARRVRIVLAAAAGLENRAILPRSLDQPRPQDKEVKEDTLLIPRTYT